MASTTPPDTEEELKPEDDVKPFEDVKKALDSPGSISLPFERVKEPYDTLVTLYPDEMYVDGEKVDGVEAGVHPSRESYNSSNTDALDFLNEYSQGDTLMLAFGFSSSPDYGKDVPTYREIREKGLETEGNWWDHLDEVEADVLLDRDSFYGAADVHTVPEVFEMAYEDETRQVYLLENQ